MLSRTFGLEGAEEGSAISQMRAGLIGMLRCMVSVERRNSAASRTLFAWM